MQLTVSASSDLNLTEMNLKDKPDALAPPIPPPASPLSDETTTKRTHADLMFLLFDLKG